MSRNRQLSKESFIKLSVKVLPSGILQQCINVEVVRAVTMKGSVLIWKLKDAPICYKT